jgi:hypothetical protein
MYTSSMPESTQLGRRGQPRKVSRTFAALPEELNRWERIADREGKTVSAWIRQAVLHYEAYLEQNSPPLRVPSARATGHETRSTE